MKTKHDSMKTPRHTQSARTPGRRNAKRMNGLERTEAEENGNRAPRMVALAPAFIALAEEFGMVPERLAERVISAFAATKPTRIVVKARAFSCPAAH
jgi:hypothetical protein